MSIFGMGIPELAVIGAIAVVVFGPKKLPELGSSIGKALRGFKDEMGGGSSDQPEAEAETKPAATKPAAAKPAATKSATKPAKVKPAQKPVTAQPKPAQADEQPASEADAD
jgi:sec-independent protein translocase protein TatA